jgi:hypothetical protein
MLTRTTVAALLALSLSVTLVNASTAAKADDPQTHGCICFLYSCFCW